MSESRASVVPFSRDHLDLLELHEGDQSIITVLTRGHLAQELCKAWWEAQETEPMALLTVWQPVAPDILGGHFKAALP